LRSIPEAIKIALFCLSLFTAVLAHAAVIAGILNIDIFNMEYVAIRDHHRTIASLSRFRKTEEISIPGAKEQRVLDNQFYK
jgi:hypothetical protein